MPHCASPTPHAFGPVLVCFLAVILVLSALPRFASCSSSSTSGWLASDFPDPRVNPPGDCGFTSGEFAWVTPAADPANATNWVCDPDRVLSLDEALSLANYLNSLSHQSPCDCEAVECPGSDVTPTGYLIGVALVDRLNIEGMTFEPLNVKAANFAKATRAKWFSGLGCDDNALVFYSRFSNELYISIGETVEGVVSDLELASLYRLGEQYLTVDDSSSSSQRGAGDEGQTTPSSSAVTHDGLVAVVSNLNEAILNGPSISSDIIFAFSIPLLLLVVLTVMCLVSNICCAQDISVPEPSVSRRSRTEVDAKSENEEDAKSENEEDAKSENEEETSR
ncbi:uncharacterized protein LOC119734832 [Patiria miniata]|uniref:Uncharacterized protein n=1 Tax=Patiria miniata TaxID=46514 RepID=A0A914AL87_PATMI|nr:uncharacterized protein LOC119734832 [Patiria miniata]